MHARFEHVIPPRSSSNSTARENDNTILVVEKDCFTMKIFFHEPWNIRIPNCFVAIFEMIAYDIRPINLHIVEQDNINWLQAVGTMRRKN